MKLKNKELDGAALHFLSERGINIPDTALEMMKAEMNALREAYNRELKFIEELPKELHYLYAKYRSYRK